MIGIIGAMKVELEALKARLQDVTVTRISGVDFYSGKLHGTDVVATVSGVGKVFAAVCAQTMVLKFGVNAIINTGLSLVGSEMCIRDRALPEDFLPTLSLAKLRLPLRSASTIWTRPASAIPKV